MIVVGVCLVIFFLVGGYLSCGKMEKSSPPKLRGPVKDPPRLGQSFDPMRCVNRAAATSNAPFA
jgi:hypothetical protein